MVRARTTGSRPGSAAEFARIRVLVDEFVERPGPELDHALDAAAECFARHGLTHTSISAIARQLGVSKATVYRQVGSVSDALRLVVARELHDLFDDLERELADRAGSEAVVVTAATVTRRAIEHPLMEKLLADEPHIVGELLPNLRPLVAAAASVLEPIIADAMEAGEIRAGDPAALADLIVRLSAVAVLLPPPDLVEYFRSALLPHLEPR